MDVLYKLEKATVADVLGELPDKRNYSTVRAQLRVLDQKGMVQHELAVQRRRHDHHRCNLKALGSG